MTEHNAFDQLNKAIAERTNGKLLGEMTNTELATAFADGPIMLPSCEDPGCHNLGGHT